MNDELERICKEAPRVYHRSHQSQRPVSMLRFERSTCIHRNRYTSLLDENIGEQKL
jgi:hypothetical protein